MKAFLILTLIFSLKTNAESLTDQLKNLAEINSGSNNQDGVKRVQQWLAKELEDLHFHVETDANGLVTAHLKGITPRKVTLVMHADTVFEKSSPFQHFRLSDDGKTAYGPGVADDKGGMIVAIEGLRRYLAEGVPAFTIEVVSSAAEEIGSEKFIEKFKILSKESSLVLGFEPAMEENGGVVQSRRGNRWYHLIVQGREVHSGRSHKDGINACYTLADKLNAISKLTDYKKNVTVSVGWMSGGQDKYNIMCGHAEAKIDTRFALVKDRDQLHEKILKILKTPTGEALQRKAEVSFEIANDGPPFTANKESRPMIQKYLAAIQQVEGQELKAVDSLGSADTGYFSREGLAILDGLGPVGGKIHTADEFVAISSLNTRAEALHLFLSQLYK